MPTLERGGRRDGCTDPRSKFRVKDVDIGSERGMTGRTRRRMRDRRRRSVEKMRAKK
jgi:hypothetical protein